MATGDNEPTENERRAGTERRTEADDKEWSERRTGEDRRSSEDRRGIYCSVRYTNPQAIEKLREWLAEHCKGDFEINVPEDMKELRKWGKYRVRFELQEDRKKLALLIGVHWPKWLG
ncbi:MAG: hypothetical protein CMM59_22340 [Rhodospirillaceae bacterium]|nr:hypothetical protein [Rhodospirillaceae bacterium]